MTARLDLRDGLPFVTMRVVYHSAEVELADVLVDTGSASTVLAADQVSRIGIQPDLSDVLYTLRGVGGREVVFSRQVDRVQVGAQSLHEFTVEIGGLDYGFAINGILGMDFLLANQAIVDLDTLELRFEHHSLLGLPGQ